MQSVAPSLPLTGNTEMALPCAGDGKANKTSYSTFLRSLITSIVIKYNLLIFRLESKGLSELVIVNAMGLLKLI